MSVASASVEKSRSFLPLMLSRAGLMRGRRCLAEPELELALAEPDTEGGGEGAGDDGRLTDFSEK